ncbi:MAG: glycosyltransferase family 2 protein [Solirubrobacterales bacterium]
MRPDPPAGTPADAARAPIVIVAARNEADRLARTLTALGEAFPHAAVWVADDASEDGTAEIGLAAGARVVTRRSRHGKGASVTAAAEALLSEGGDEARIVLLCDGDLGSSAARLGPLVEAVEHDECDLAIGAFARRVGGGLGIALGVSRWTVERLGRVRLEAPLSGQRAMRVGVLRELVPFADGFGLETGMDVDAARAGYRVREVELDLEHRATGRSPAGFLHRGRQLRDILRVYLSRR